MKTDLRSYSLEVNPIILLRFKIPVIMEVVVLMPRGVLLKLLIPALVQDIRILIICRSLIILIRKCEYYNIYRSHF